MRKRVKREERKENAVLEKQEKTTLNTTRPKSVHNLLKQSFRITTAFTFSRSDIHRNKTNRFRA